MCVDLYHDTLILDTFSRNAKIKSKYDYLIAQDSPIWDSILNRIEATYAVKDVHLS